MPTPRTIVIVYPHAVVHTPIEVPLLKLRDRGHRVVLWTTSAEGDLHAHYRRLGLEAHGEPAPPWPGPARHLFFARRLGRFLAEHPADVVFSHLQPANVVAVLARTLRLVDVPVIAFRHSATAFHLASPALRAVGRSRNEQALDWFLSRNAEHIVAPGTGVRDVMLREGCDAARISVIPYLYDFDHMARSVDPARVAELRAAHPARLRMIAVMRFVPMKRHPLVIETLAELVRRGHDVNLTLVDRGPELERIEHQIDAVGLRGRVELVGFSKEVLTQLAASDLLLCPSLTDASNNVTKEAGLVQRPVVVVQGVGDFDDYVRDGDNGFLVPAAEFVPRAVRVAEGLLDGSIDGAAVGRRLAEAVRARFTVRDEVIDRYEALMEQVIADAERGRVA